MNRTWSSRVSLHIGAFIELFIIYYIEREALSCSLCTFVADLPSWVLGSLDPICARLTRSTRTHTAGSYRVDIHMIS